MSSVLQSLSNAQIAALIPALAQRLQSASSATTESIGETTPDREVEGAQRLQYTNEEMFEKKKRNARSTPAQTYLLVSDN